MRRLAALITAAAGLGLLLGGALWNMQALAKTKGGCSEAQVCCRYLKDGVTEFDCMDAKSCADRSGKEVPDKSKCAL